MIKSPRFITSVQRKATEQPQCTSTIESSLEKILMTTCCRNQPLEIYLDTCSLLCEDGENLLHAVETTLPQLQMHLTIFSSVFTELENVGQKDPSQRAACERVWRHLKAMEKNNMVRIVIGDNNHFSDPNFIAAFVHQMQLTNILFLSQDNDLCNTVSKLEQFLSPCIHTDYEITVYTLKNGTMLEYREAKQERGGTNFKFIQKRTHSPVQHENKPEHTTVRFYPM